MATRQYIGARYVTKFFDDGEGGSNWIPLRAYEALTVVTRNGSSYTSKIPVPATSNTPPEQDTEHWVLTANYSAQVEQYRQEVVQVQNDMNTLSASVDTRIADLEISVDGDIAHLRTDINAQLDTFEDHIESEIAPTVAKVEQLDIAENGITVCVMDSYGTSYANPSGNNKTVFDFVLESQYYNSSNFIGKAFSGDGLISSGGTGKNFIQEMNEWLTGFADKNKIKEFHIASGRNEIAYESDAILTAMRNMVTMLKGHCPQALVYFEFVACSSHDSQIGVPRDLIHVHDTFARANEVGAFYIGGMEAVLHYGLYVADDGIHPNLDGKKALGHYLAKCMHDKSVSVNTEWATPRFDETEHKDSRVSYGAGSLAPRCAIIENEIKYKFFPNDISSISISGGWTLPQGLPNISLGAIYNRDKNPFIGISENIVLPVRIILRGTSIDTIGATLVLTPDMEIRMICYNPGGDIRTVTGAELYWIGGTASQPVMY